MDRPSFGTLLQRYRLAGGLTQQVLAELAGISVRAISDLERGIKAHPRRYTVRQLATALRLGAEDRAVFERAARGVSLADAPSAPTTPLRAPLSPLIGREKDEAELVTLLRWQGARLLTVTGPGGVGKTRLAQQVAEDLRADFADGVLVISLAALREPRQVLSSVAAALGLRQHGSQATLGLLVAYLERRHMLVVLDNMEHLTGAAGDLVTILAACPDLQLLVTSRAPLRVRGEVIREVAPLELPSGGGRSARARRSPAVTLFCLCAGASQTGPTQTDPELEIITEICRRVDGLPLAIELAASRTSLLAPSDLLARLERRLPLLTGGPRDLPARQQTMRDTIPWSYDLLDEDDRTVVRRLSVFAGGANLDAITEVCNPDGDLDVLTALSSLVGQSLLRRAGVDPPRYAMLETIREYVSEQLEVSGEVERVKEAHAEHYFQLAREARSQLYGPHQSTWLDRLEADLDNMRAAMDWLVAQQHMEKELEIATALQRFWVGHAHLREGREWIRRGLRAGTDVPPRVRGGALSAASWLARIQEEFEEATLLATEALSLWRDLGDQKEIAGTLDALGDVALYGGNDSAAARPLYEESLALRRELRDEWALAMSLNGVGLVCLEQGEPVRAAELLEEGLAHARTAGDQRGVAILLTSMGLASLDRGDPETATTYLHEALGIFSRLGNDLDAGICLEELACVAHASGDHRRAAQLFGAADKVLGPLMSSARHGVLFRRGKGSVAATRAELGEGAFADSWEAGHALELEEAVTFALGANQRTTWIQ